MYLDLSLKKLVIIGTVLLVMFSAISYTLTQKVSYFGTTPYEYSISLGLRYAFDTLVYSVESAFPRLFAGSGFVNASNDAPGHATSVPVLTYHRIVADSSDHNNVTVSQFKDQMESLKRAGWQAVNLPQFESFMRGETDLPARSFLITFDDGAKESFYPVDPVLRALGFNAVMFVIAHSADSAQSEGSVYYLSPQEIERMIKSGRWDIGSHSYDGHRPYPVDETGTSTGIFFADKLWNGSAMRLETDEEFANRVRDDLAHSKQDLESEYGVRVQSFAFPLGNETGQEGANNYPSGAGETAKIASSIYQFGYLQLSNQTYRFNFPRSSSSSSISHLSDPFLVRRIHVDYDWDGDRLLSILEDGLPKDMPYEDDFTTDQGWIQAWGHLDVGRNNFTLGGASGESNASTFLDGTALWDDYSFDAAINWQKGNMFMLADVVDADTYDSCAYAPGQVRIFSTKGGVVKELATVRDPRIRFGQNVSMGIRVHDSAIECTWNFESIAEVQSRTSSGGVGFQMWDDTPGTTVQITSMIVRPYARSQ